MAMNLDEIDRLVSKADRRNRLVPGPETALPPSLPRHSSSRSTGRTEPIIYDYGNDARQSSMELDEGTEMQRSISQEVGNSGAAFSHAGSPPAVTEQALDLALGEEDVYQSLIEALQPDRTNKLNRFLPRGSLLDICTYENVERVLQENAAFQGDQLGALHCTQYVCGTPSRLRSDARSTAREIFATLVLIKRIGIIRDFMEKGVVDDHLPLRYDENPKRLSPRRTSDKHEVEFFKGESSDTIQEFYTKQWWVHVPFISRGRTAREYELAEETILPWSEYQDPVSGAYGSVHRVKIHSDHHNFGARSARSTRKFALKILTGAPEDAKQIFEAELKAFRKNKNWKHVVELYATFQRGNQFMFLFPWAAGGSLGELMTKGAHPPTLRSGTSDEGRIEFTRWIHQQCGGLIEALLNIHEYLDERTPDNFEAADDEDVYGVHYDIKPGNILHFTDGNSAHGYGTLKLADFGLLKYHSRSNRTRQVSYTYPPDQSYKCPEHDFSGVLSRKVDIWALGCVFLELLTWAIRGTGSTETFCAKRSSEIARINSRGRKIARRDDSFFARQRRPRRQLVTYSILGRSSNVTSFEEPVLKRSVVEWISDLEDIADCEGPRTFLQEFLGKIQTCMLHVDREERIDCNRMHAFFQQCKESGEANREYWMFPEGVSPRVEEWKRHSIKQKSADAPRLPAISESRSRLFTWQVIVRDRLWKVAVLTGFLVTLYAVFPQTMTHSDAWLYGSLKQKYEAM